MIRKGSVSVSNLSRHTPLGSILSAKTFTNTAVVLTEEPFLGIAKLNTRGWAGNEWSIVKSLIGAALPHDPNRVASGAHIDAGWLSPEEWLLIGEEQEIARVCAKLTDMITGRTLLITDLTHGRCSIRMKGETAGDVLSSLTPLDFCASSFSEGSCAQSVFGETGAFIQNIGDSYGYRVIVDQSYAVYAWRMLENACQNITTY